MAYIDCKKTYTVKMDYQKMDRREFCRGMAAVLVAAPAKLALPHETKTFQLRYIVGSSMYGKMAIRDVLPEVRNAGTISGRVRYIVTF